MAFFRLEPWGADTENRRAGVIAATVANAASKGGSHTFTSSDFFKPSLEAPGREQSIDEQIAVLKAASNGQRSNSHS